MAGGAGLGGTGDTQPLACFPRPVLLAGSISFSLKPFPAHKAPSDALPHPLMPVYLPFICQEPRPVSLRGFQADLEPVKPPEAKEGEFLSLFLYTAKRNSFIKDGSGKDSQHR